MIASDYEGTVNGLPVSGSAAETMDSYCDDSFGPERDGMQRVSVIAGPFAETNEFDTGTATLQFQAVQQPAGEFKVAFVFGGGDGSPGDETCGGSRHHTVSRDGRLISFIQALFDDDDVPTLENANSIDVTPDGQYVVATAFSALNLFLRDGQSGTITFVESLIDDEDGVDGLDSPVALEVSPEGTHVFVAAHNDESIATFELTEGHLTFSSAVYDGVGGVTGISTLEGLTLFGSYVYAGTTNGVTVFERDHFSGELTFLEEYNHPNLHAAFQPTVSPDRRHLYVGDQLSNIVVLEIDLTTGLLNFVEDLAGVGSSNLTIPGDGRHLYATAGSVLRVFERNPTTGRLNHLTTYTLSDFADFIRFPRALAASPTDDTILLAGEDSVSAFVRRPDGGLKYLDSEIEGDGPVEGIPEVLSMSLSPDGKHLYTASRGAIPSQAAGSVAAFVAGPAFIFTDDFESGDTSAWSSTVP